MDDKENLNLKHEDLINEMNEHCQMWKRQREYVQEKRDEAKEDFRNKVLWPDRRDMLVGDYFPNLDLPHFGGEQPGETYYFPHLQSTDLE